MERNLNLALLFSVVAGSETTVTTLHAIFLALTMFPEVQRKAQEEIDRVIGTDRLPTLHEYVYLPSPLSFSIGSNEF
jgi:cytochrome P450